MGKLDINTQEGLLKVKEEFTKVFDKHIEAATLSEAVKKITNIPFGKINFIFENISKKLYESSKGRKLLGEYVKTIVENKDLKKEYGFYSLLKKPTYNEDTKLFLSEAVNIAKRRGESYNKGLKKLSETLIKCVYESKISSADLLSLLDDENNKLFNSVETLLSEDKSINNLGKYLSNFNYVHDFMKGNISTLTENTSDISNDGTSLVEQINSTCSNMEQWEANVIKDISLAALSNKDSKTLFEEYKNKCIQKLEESLSDDDASMNNRIDAMKTQLAAKEYNEETFVNDLLKLSELNETLD